MKKQSKRIKSARDLPSWFSLEAYKPLAKFDARQWAWLIQSRIKWMELHGTDASNDEFGALFWLDERATGERWNSLPGFGGYCDEGPRLPDEGDWIWHSLDDATKNRIEAIHEKHWAVRREFFNTASYDELHLGAVCAEFRYNVVAPIHRGLAYGFYLESKQKRQVASRFALVERYYRELDESLKEMHARVENRAACHAAGVPFDEQENKTVQTVTLTQRAQADKYFNQPFDEWYAPVVVVNLQASDDLIMDEFKKWLADQRAQHPLPENKIINEQDFKKWQAYQIFPYFDLMYWATLEGVKIDESALLDALFPCGINGDERHAIRRAKDWAKKVICRETVDMLHAQEVVATKMR
ncbi:hypothetical protein SAMN05660284_00257 [Formivibrio citricus]|uniref:Uncharacterized protein n=1 Tax=Formivibrio citricus TaxID=83765 RepID=A0A1I4VKY5_9NEIS|nr:DUF6387 family protein [Formivibrio citricus]SFN01789.1 hypothetical protein SAMN05660284_00257 [Formivibrio citricus]